MGGGPYTQVLADLKWPGDRLSHTEWWQDHMSSRHSSSEWSFGWSFDEHQQAGVVLSKSLECHCFVLPVKCRSTCLHWSSALGMVKSLIGDYSVVLRPFTLVRKTLLFLEGMPVLSVLILSSISLGLKTILWGAPQVQSPKSFSPYPKVTSSSHKYLFHSPVFYRLLRHICWPCTLLVYIFILFQMDCKFLFTCCKKKSRK